MRKSIKKFLFFAVLWNSGALLIFLCALVSTTNMRGVLGSTATGFLWCCGLSLTGITGMYLCLLNPAEQISWTRTEFCALGRYCEIWDIAGFIFIMTAVTSVIVRYLDTPIAPFSYACWMGFSAFLLLVPSHFLTVWQMENREEFERAAPLDHIRYKQ